jgi:hypothetical protein
MAETTADVRRDIELTRNRMSETLSQLEQKMNVMQIVRDHPWPALAVAVAAGAVLAGSKSDVKAAAATVGATKGASSKLGSLLDDAVASLVGGVHGAVESKLEGWVNELKTAIGANIHGNGTQANAQTQLPSATQGSPSLQRSYDGLAAASAGTLGASDSSQLGRAD